MSNKAIKEKIIERIANGQPWAKTLGREKWKVGNLVIHVRYRTSLDTDGLSYFYNINPNTLTSDYEVWSGGSGHDYYCIPIAEIKRMYDDPAAYPDRTHPEMRVAHINTATHFATYATHLNRVNFKEFYRFVFPQITN